MTPTNETRVVAPANWTGTVEKYIAHYGGRCRDCGDADGVCTNSGMPCHSAVAGACFQHALRAIEYGVKHGYLAIAAPAAPAQEPVAWPDIGDDPMRGPADKDRLANAIARIRAAYVQQQSEVPDQTALVWRYDIGQVLQDLIRLRAWQEYQHAAPVPDSAPDGLQAAIRFVEKRRDDYIGECGHYDPSTGVTEFPDGGEYVGELEEIIEGLVALRQTHAKAASVPARAPAVRKLVWRESQGWPGYVAVSPIGTYTIEIDARTGWHTLDHCQMGRSTYTTIKAAQAAAQADFGRRVRECLEDGAPTHRHIKRGSAYSVVGQADFQASQGIVVDGVGTPNVRYKSVVTEGDLLTVYRDTTTGKLYARHQPEFEDGRFEVLPPPPATEGR